MVRDDKAQVGCCYDGQNCHFGMGGDIGFILLLGFVGFSGLALYAFGATVPMLALLAIQLG